MLRSPLRFVFLWLLTVAAASAHDFLQSSTDLWLRPDSMEVDLVMARAIAVALLNGAPANLITDDNFDDTYAPKLQEVVAPGLLNFTLNGQPLQPLLTKVALSEETDIKFAYIYPRPPAGRLRLTTPFMKKMPAGFENSIGIKDGTRVLGYADQRVNDPPWEINLNAPVPVPAADSNQPAPSAASGTARTMPVNSDIRLPIWGYLLITVGVFAAILLPEYWRRRKNKAPDDDSPWPPRR